MAAAEGDGEAGDLDPGYDMDLFDEKPDDELVCPVCHQVMKNPQLVVKCGHHFCKRCIDQILRLQRNPFCALDRQPLSKDPGQIVDDRSIARRIGALKTSCTRKTSGCTWKGVLSDLEAHVKSLRCVVACKYGCGAKISFIVREEHQKKECRKFKLKCPFKRIGKGCSAEVDREHMNVHLKDATISHQLLLAASMETLLDNVWQTSVAPPEERRTVYDFQFLNFNEALEHKARLYSEPFYSGPCDTGYCLQLRVETGDSPDGVSVYYCLARGKNDDHVDWPFRRNVRLQVLHSKDKFVVATALTTPPVGREAAKAIISRPVAKRNTRGRGKKNILPFERFDEAGIREGNSLRVRCVVPWSPEDMPKQVDSGEERD